MIKLMPLNTIKETEKEGMSQNTTRVAINPFEHDNKTFHHIRVDSSRSKHSHKAVPIPLVNESKEH